MSVERNCQDTQSRSGILPLVAAIVIYAVVLCASYMQ
jgi:hypothetical protein